MFRKFHHFLELISLKMRSLYIMYRIIFLSWSLVEVHSQTFPYVSFMGKTLANHSYVDLSLVGRPDVLPGLTGRGPSVECHTHLSTCCSGSEGVYRGDWYFPNGTRLPTPQSTGIFEARDSQRVDLRRNVHGLKSGIYRCDIPTDAVHDVNDTSVRDRPVYVGLYTSGGGMYSPTIYISMLITTSRKCYNIWRTDNDSEPQWSQSSVHPHLYLHWWTCYHCHLDQRLHHCH